MKTRLIPGCSLPVRLVIPVIEENNITGDTILPRNGQPADLPAGFMVNAVKKERYSRPVGIS